MKKMKPWKDHKINVGGFTNGYDTMLEYDNYEEEEIWELRGEESHLEAGFYSHLFNTIFCCTFIVRNCN